MAIPRTTSASGLGDDKLSSMDPGHVFELYRIYRSHEEHENDLINHRTSWLVTIQSVLIGTFGFSFQKFYEIIKLKDNGIAVSQEGTTTRYAVFLMVLCIIGLSSCIFAHLSVRAGSDAQRKVRAEWDNIRGKLPVVGLPPLAGGGHDPNDTERMKGNIFSRAIVFIFSILWISIIMAVILRVSVNIGIF